MKFTQSKLHVETSSQSKGELFFPVVIGVASSHRHGWFVVAVHSADVLLLLSWATFRSRLNTFTVNLTILRHSGNQKYHHPTFLFSSLFFLFLFRRRFLGSSRNRSPLFCIFVSIRLRVRVEQSAHTFYSWVKISHTYIFKSKRSATKPNSHSHSVRGE